VSVNVNELPDLIIWFNIELSKLINEEIDKGWFLNKNKLKTTLKEYEEINKRMRSMREIEI